MVKCVQYNKHILFIMHITDIINQFNIHYLGYQGNLQGKRWLLLIKMSQSLKRSTKATGRAGTEKKVIWVKWSKQLLYLQLTRP